MARSARLVLIATLSALYLPAQEKPAEGPQQAAVTLNKYCVTCHNDRLKTAGLVLNPADLTRVPANAETWEKVVRKLQAGAMPPAGAPKPDASTSLVLRSYLETELDKSAAANPRAGKQPLLHRLTRTEYENAIRDLLGIEALPKEVDISFLLPADNASSGFDNLADLLFISPSTMERYIDAAHKISRFAVGDPKMPLLVNVYKMDPEHPQDERVDELPFGTRGGLAIRSDFPVDGNYVVKVEMASGAMRDPYQLEILVDGEHAAGTTLGGAPAGPGRGRGRGAGAEHPLEFRVRVKAGLRIVGVTFAEHSEGFDESTLKPRMRTRGILPSIASVTLTGPYDVASPGESESRKRIFICSDSSDACAGRILTNLVHHAYRRPATDADLAELMPFYEEGKATGNFDLGVEKAVERLLVSPQFLYRIEREPANVHPGAVRPGVSWRVSDLELASRLSFFLWSSIPDDRLLDLAEHNKLHEPAVLSAEVGRMLADKRADALATNFAEQWLYLRDIEAKQPDEILFPEFDQTLREAMHEETQLFLGSVFRENRSILDLLSANYTFLNERLAQHYGIPGIRGSYFRRYTFPADSPRGGLLGQGSILTITSYSNRTSAVLRGKWVLQNLLASAPPPPPPNVPSLKTEGKEPGKTLTLREAMTAHRADPACAGCHARMDPIGFAMENFDAVGKFRERDSDNTIDVAGVLPDGATFEGVRGLKKELLRHPDQFVGAATENLLMYALGRNVQYYDEPSVREIVRSAREKQYAVRAWVEAVVKAPAFQMREASQAESKESR
jgi:mono/diheme cytochrome c family protein